MPKDNSSPKHFIEFEVVPEGNLMTLDRQLDFIYDLLYFMEDYGVTKIHVVLGENKEE